MWSLARQLFRMQAEAELILHGQVYRANSRIPTVATPGSGITGAQAFWLGPISLGLCLASPVAFTVPPRIAEMS